MNQPPERECTRDLALFKRGQPLSGVTCWYSWSGSVPMSGRLRCPLCGRDKDPEPRDNQEVPA